MSGVIARSKVDLAPENTTGENLRHAVVSVIYRGEPIPAPVFGGAVEEALDDRTAEVVSVMSYGAPFHKPPHRLALREVWINLPDEVRAVLEREVPELCEAIRLMFVKEG